MGGIERLTSSLSTNSLFYTLLGYCNLEYHMIYIKLYKSMTEVYKTHSFIN